MLAYYDFALFIFSLNNMNTLLLKFPNTKGVSDTFQTVIEPNEAFESAKQEEIRNIALNGFWPIRHLLL